MSSAPSMSSSSSSESVPEQTSSGSSLSSSSSSTSPVSSADNSSTPIPAPTSATQSSTTSTSASPTTTSTPTTTPQSSPAQTSSAAAQTTSSTPAAPAPASASFSSTTAPTTTGSTSFTSQVATTYVSTDPGGSVVYVTSTVPQVITTAVSSSTDGGSSSNTAVIVGGVVGGVAGIAILALLLFCIRKRVRKDEFDGNFDPDRVVGHDDGGGGTLPNVDLTDEVTPFPQPYTDQGSPSMRQYGKSPYTPVPSSLGASGHASTEFYPPGAAGASTLNAQPRPFMQPGPGSPPPGVFVPPVNMYGTGPVDWHNPRPGVSPPPSTVSNNTTSTRVTKEREAMGRGGQGTGLGLATQHEVAEGSGDVVVHQDAGRAPNEEHTPPREIPPAYESIRD